VFNKYHFTFGNAINRAPTVVSLCRLTYRVVVPRCIILFNPVNSDNSGSDKINAVVVRLGVVVGV
jgi:hypothetical protein